MKTVILIKPTGERRPVLATPDPAPTPGAPQQHIIARSTPRPTPRDKRWVAGMCEDAPACGCCHFENPYDN